MKLSAHKILLCCGRLRQKQLANLFIIINMIDIQNSLMQSVGPALKELRQRKGLSQKCVAAEAAIGRTTLVHMEQGSDVQISNLSRVAHVLGVSFGLVSEDPLIAQRKAARHEQRLKDLASREKHLRLALSFALGGEDAAQIKSDAIRMVDLWERNNTCSRIYIESWRDILNGSSEEIARSLANLDSGWGPALRQNTPFVVRQS